MSQTEQQDHDRTSSGAEGFAPTSRRCYDVAAQGESIYGKAADAKDIIRVIVCLAFHLST
jgi:hypothetical protein